MIVKNIYTNNKNQKNALEEGMRVTLLGGSNMKENGNTNSMGYFIISKNNELIFKGRIHKISLFNSKFTYQYFISQEIHTQNKSWLTAIVIVIMECKKKKFS